ncbi:MAG: PorT family protein [Sporocytophaga sp.]|uniref:porin family protein n=1 Tax=Sporocytophaga sp. TaxID=2231183 RepID=UPI001B0AFEEE|nr:porin family protein [Sporocytophaga sp.]MBO9701713.1 PorT family protein [Sporocytophaga sp.]
MKKIFFFLSFLLFALASGAQTTTDSLSKHDEYKGRHLIRAFRLDLYLNQLSDQPGALDLRTWGSRGGAFGHYSHIKISKKFYFTSGLCIAFDNYSFSAKNTNLSISQDSLLIFVDRDPEKTYKKSKLSLTYLDAPLELRFQSKRYWPRALKLAIGFKAGLLLKSMTKVKFKENDETIKEKEIRDFNLNRVRYGLTARIGIGGLSLYGYYSLNKLFKDNKGPEATPFLVGITISSF